MDERKRFWNLEYSRDEFIYGRAPSYLAEFVVSRFKGTGRRLLEIGCGYGRDLIFYALNGFAAEGVDISDVAISQGRRWTESLGVKVRFYEGDFLEVEFEEDSFDIIVSYHTLYLLSKEEREEAVQKIFSMLKPGGITAHLVFSKEEDTYGKGREVEKDSFEWAEGKIVHYFEREELQRLFGSFRIIELSRVDIKEFHDSREHIHKDWLIIASKEERRCKTWHLNNPVNQKEKG